MTTTALESAENEKGAGIGPRDKLYNTPLAYLRAFIIVLVVAHHSVMAYHIILTEPLASSLADHLGSMQAISPVIDAQRSGMLSLFAAFNDGFFMPLLFFVSGLFVWNSLRRKGRLDYFRDRLLRLGLPLVLMVALRPLTYYATYLQLGGDGGLADFWQQWSSIEWRGGPIWFLEVLLVFDALVVLASFQSPGLPRTSKPMESGLVQSPMKFYVGLVLLSVLAYVPISVAYGSFFWVQIGPADVQINRVFLYAVYFGMGIFFGAHGLERTFIGPDSALARRWALWSVAGLVAFVIHLVTSLGAAHEILKGCSFVLSCATISMGFLALFLNFAQTPRNLFDSLFDNCYGIYVIHYGVVGWMSYILLDAEMPAVAKWSIVFAASMVICWGATAAIRRIPGVARVL
ncbi:MAG: acyltransferase [Deltaproteobacteria bacterium]|nr:acyltransferase [Deltaproteobacteria bacterium]